MKETRELAVALFKSINSITLAAKDGIGLEDIGLLIPLILSWQAAIKDLTFAQDAAKATPADIEAMFASASAELSGLSAEVKYAVVAIAKGAYAGYWIAARKGYEAGLKAAKIS